MDEFHDRGKAIWRYLTFPCDKLMSDIKEICLFLKNSIIRIATLCHRFIHAPDRYQETRSYLGAKVRETEPCIYTQTGELRPEIIRFQ